jgi:hypothetical protein
MIDYSHCVVYRIINKQTGEILYVASTCDFKQEEAKNKQKSSRPIYTYHKEDIYKHIKSLGGWDFVEMLMVEEFRDCQNELQQKKKEREYVDELNPLYRSLAILTKDEKRIRNNRMERDSRKKRFG